jgi:glutamate formiminotransferase
VKLCKEAYSLVNFREHTGSHPALGTVDHVSFSPLGPGTTLDETKEVARAFAAQLHNSDKIPIYFYGEASLEKMKLKDIRRDLGYFDYPSDCDPESKEVFLLNLAGKLTELKPSLGSNSDFTNERGLMCVGTVAYVQNFNMRFRQEDSRKAVMQVTKAVRSSSVSKLAGATALFLSHTSQLMWVPSKVY